jgi:hypothetical protein
LKAPLAIYSFKPKPILRMHPPYPQAQFWDEFEDQVAIWNTNPVIRFGVVLAVLGFVWSLVAPSEPTSLAMAIVDAFFGGLGLVGFVSLATELVKRVDWGTDREKSRFSWLPRPRFETRVLGGGQRSAFPPQRPAGYQPAREMATGSMAKRLALAFIWIVPLLWVSLQFWGAIIALWGTPFVGDFEWILFVGATVAVTIFHEAIHALAAVFYGCGISTGVVLPLGAYIRPSGGFLSRQARMLISLAPLVVINLGAGLVLFHADGWLVAVAFVALFTNTLGAVDDIRSVWYLLKVPSKRLYYSPPDRDRPTLVYDHLSQRNTASLLKRCEETILWLTTSLRIEQKSTARYSR